MADFTPTPSQREAIKNRGGALLVSAAAGSGKTRVLTERLIGYLTNTAESADIDEFLVITYTKAAAAELRGRITDEISALAAADPAKKKLRRQQALIQRASIGTIHSFCSTLLREHCHALGLSPDFAVAEEDRAQRLREMCLQRVLERAYEKPPAGFLTLVDTVGVGRDDARLAGFVLLLHAKIQCHARPEVWVRQQISALHERVEDAAATPYGRELIDRAMDTAEYWAGELDNLLALMAREEYAYIGAAYSKSVGESADALRSLAALRGSTWDKIREAAAAILPFPRLGPLRAPKDSDIAEHIKARRKYCKSAVEKLELIFAEPSAKLLSDMERTAPAMEALLDLTLKFDAAYAAEKRRRSLVDFSDLEHMAARLLTDESGKPTETAREVSRRFREVMIDEYQDVSAVQELIIKAVSRDEKNLFMVGDVKQSIYRFRLADPGIFIEKYLSYLPAGEVSEGQPRRVLLRENFRSRAEVLEGANAVFRAIMSPALGDIEYDDAAALIPGASYEGAGRTPELMLLDAPDGGDEEPSDKLASEARFTAERIRALVDSRELIFDHGALRPVSWGDIAILLRSANVCGGVYRQELARAGIPVLSDQAGGFFVSPEITVMLSLLAVIDNKRQDVPLIAALRSPLFRFTADELSAVRASARDGDFYSALEERAKRDKKCREVISTLDSFRALAPDMTPSELLREIYAKLDLMALTCAAPDGAVMRENLCVLSELARASESAGVTALHGFLARLRSMAERGEEPRSGGAASGGAVRIMSIHKSKGLEFPVVFLCDTARRFNKSDSRATVLVHPQLGLGPKLTDAARGIEYPTLARRAVALRLERETLSEELRLLYVAMTRAREMLFITATLPDAAATVSKLSATATFPVAAEELITMQSPAHWLISAALADGMEHISLTLAGQGGEESAGAEEDTQTATEPAAVGDNPPHIPDLAERLDWCYPHKAASALPSKITATEIKSLGEEDGEAGSLLPRAKLTFDRPDFIREGKRLTPTERGTATHLALRYIDFSKTNDEQEIREELIRLAANGMLSEREERAVDAAALFALFDSDLGKRIKKAKRVLREHPFTLLCPAERFFNGGEGEEILLQGVIDCLIEEEDGFVVIDYKTDNVTAERTDERAARYSPQLRAYAWAVERMTGERVKECCLYFLRPKKAVNVFFEK